MVSSTSDSIFGQVASLVDYATHEIPLPYSALAMIGHVSSVERLYPTMGKYELL
jgi:hypothetical protein